MKLILPVVLLSATFSSASAWRRGRAAQKPSVGSTTKATTTCHVVLSDIKLDDKFSIAVELTRLNKEAAKNNGHMVVVLSAIQDMEAGAEQLHDFLKLAHVDTSRMHLFKGYRSKKPAPHEETWAARAPQEKTSIAAAKRDLDASAAALQEFSEQSLAKLGCGKQLTVTQIAPSDDVRSLVQWGYKLDRMHLVYGYNAKRSPFVPEGTDEDDATRQWAQELKHNTTNLIFTNNFASFQKASGGTQPYDVLSAAYPHLKSHIDASLKDGFYRKQIMEYWDTIQVTALDRMKSIAEATNTDLEQLEKIEQLEDKKKQEKALNHLLVEWVYRARLGKAESLREALEKDASGADTTELKRMIAVQKGLRKNAPLTVEICDANHVALAMDPKIESDMVDFGLTEGKGIKFVTEDLNPKDVIGKTFLNQTPENALEQIKKWLPAEEAKKPEIENDVAAEPLE